MDTTTYYLTKNECFIEAKPMTPVGIVVHSTGANNPNLKRYVQPDDGRLGKGGSNHWNKKGVYKCAHAMIGKDKEGKVCTYLTLPTNICAWGVGQGSKGSYNYPPTACLQFEICEDGLDDREYLESALKEAAELCAMWCKEFSLSASSIRSHKEAHAEGYASNHADIDHWLKRYGMTMNDFRADVEALLADTAPEGDAKAPTDPVGTGVLDGPAPEGDAKAPTDLVGTGVPDGPSDVPDGPSDVPDGPSDVPDGPAPEGDAKAPTDPVGTGVLDGPFKDVKAALLGLAEAIKRLANTL